MRPFDQNQGKHGIHDRVLILMRIASLFFEEGDASVRGLFALR